MGGTLEEFDDEMGTVTVSWGDYPHSAGLTVTESLAADEAALDEALDELKAEVLAAVEGGDES